MKTVRRISKEEGVSPVIATILMVAITVVLAAVLYVIVSGMMIGTVAGKNIAVACAKVGSTTSYKCTIPSADNGVDFTKVGIQVLQSDGTVVSSWAAGTTTGITYGGVGYKVNDSALAAGPVLTGKLVDNGNGLFGVNDDVYLTPKASSSLVGLTVKLSGGGADGSGICN